MRGGFFFTPIGPKLDYMPTGIWPTVRPPPKVPNRRPPPKPKKPRVTKKQMRDIIRGMNIPQIPTYKPNVNHNPMMY